MEASLVIILLRKNVLQTKGSGANNGAMKCYELRDLRTACNYSNEGLGFQSLLNSGNHALHHAVPLRDLSFSLVNTYF